MANPAATTPPAMPAVYLDASQPVARRVDDLIPRMTLAEKVNQLLHENYPIERLSIPGYNWWSEGCHGVGRNGRATVFPQVIGLGATWNTALVEQVATVISDEARAKHHAAIAAGRRGQYQGLTFWTPNVNIFRDPRWGRGQETFGEDPYLTGVLGSAVVRGLQGHDPRYMKAAACAKHFAVHSGPEQERHSFDACPSRKDLYETYLPAFERLVNQGVEAVMGAYNRTYGEPCCGSKFLLGEILRQRWGFQGHVVSDCGAIDDFHQHHHITADAAASAALAVRHGCDLNCGCTYNDLLVAVRTGLITVAEIETSLRRLLTTKFKLGLLDPQEQVPWSGLTTEILDCPAHRTLARQAAQESVVLLKNNGILPLRNDHDSILVTGPTAANTTALLGNYYGFSPRLITIAEGILASAAEGCRTVYRTGCPLFSPMAPGVNYTYPTAAESELTIAVVGLDPSLEGEEGDTVASPTGGDRDHIELPRVQLDFLIELRKHARKLIVVVTGGSAIAIPEVHEIADAVLQVWYPGCEGGNAVADVLFGRVAPSGKLPVTVPRRTEDLPAFSDYAMKGRTYKFAEIEPLYPFGFGLTYGKLAYGPMSVSAAQLTATSQLTVRAAVTNEGTRAVAETVQCYLVPPCSWADAPHSILVDFSKIPLAAGQQATVEFTLPAGAFAQFDATGARVHVPGTYQVVVGSASPGPRALALGAPAPAVGTVTLV